jgi:HAD superfamily hydrolase (TIGR01450 family)
VVAEHLRDLGMPAEEEDVVTSAQAAAALLRARYGPGARVALLGAAGLEAALRAEELEPVPVDDQEAVAIVSGYDPDAPWRAVMRAAVRIRDGLPWFASNTDLSFPTSYGSAPGHGVLVDMLRRFSGVDPVVAGKPERPLLEETVRRVGGRRPLMVGDRLDTDIAGAHNADVDSLLVLTGVTGLPELVAATPDQRPTYVSPDLAGLNEPQPAPERDEDGWRLGGWQARVSDGRLVVDGAGAPADWWRVVAAVAWEHRDRHGDTVRIDDVRAPAP